MFFLTALVLAVFVACISAGTVSPLWKCEKISQFAENVVSECAKIEEQSSLTSLVHSLAQLKSQIKIVEFEIARINAARGDRVYPEHEEEHDDEKSGSSSSSSSD